MHFDKGICVVRFELEEAMKKERSRRGDDEEV
jgi:hypothetical protein